MMSLAITLVLAIIVDVDRPREGVIRVSQQPLLTSRRVGAIDRVNPRSRPRTPRMPASTVKCCGFVSFAVCLPDLRPRWNPASLAINISPKHTIPSTNSFAS
jgi:hypothetical protein